MLFSIMLLSSPLAANYAFAASDDKNKKPKQTNCFSLGSFDAVLQCLKDASNQAFSVGSLDGVKGALTALIKLITGESDARKAADTNLQNQINHIQLTPGPQGPKGDKGDKGDPATFSTQTCPAGQVMIGINSAGTIICQTSSQVPADGTPCNDNNPNTINDVYLGGVCQGTASGQTCTTNPTPVLGDCRQVTCVNGQLVTTIDNSDLPSNNGNSCVISVCNNGVPQTTPTSSGTACNTSGGNVCDGAGNCVATLGCQTGQALCGNVCTDTSSDTNNCGSCGHACGAGAVCASGVCTCPAGQTSCQSGVCADLSSNVNNCGACGNVCAAGDTCTAGACVAPTVQHSNGLGQIYTDSFPLDTYTVTTATEAAMAWGHGTPVLGTCLDLSKIAYVEAGGISASWAYTGSAAGHVIQVAGNSASCPTSSDPIWH